MTISDWAIVLATLFSPLIAVRVQKFIEGAGERRSGQKRIFNILMATRATRVAFEHVQALNAIDIEFSGSRWRMQSAREKEVINRWRIYAAHLNRPVDVVNEAAAVNWNARGDELFTDLLVAPAAALGYPFDRVQLNQGIYYPRAHGEAERRREIYERAVVDVMTGAAPLNIKLTEVPTSEEATEQQKKLQEAWLAVVEGGAVKMKSVAG
jgi:hypothetical protein